MKKKLNSKIWKELVDKSKKIKISLPDLSKVDDRLLEQQIKELENEKIEEKENEQLHSKDK